MLGRVSACLGQYVGGWQVLAIEFFDLDFDRHAVTIPTRHKRRIEASQRLRFDDDVFQDLVDRVTQVNIAVRIRWAVMQDELRTAFSRLADFFVNLFILPLLDPLRLALGEIAAHRERRIGHVDRIFAGLLGFWLVRLAGFVFRLICIVGHGLLL